MARNCKTGKYPRQDKYGKQGSVRRHELNAMSRGGCNGLIQLNAMAGDLEAGMRLLEE